jgi:lipid II:glycine glycyltransferase (peptidoglycan interpeptide bridge formation enzyme)
MIAFFKDEPLAAFQVWHFKDTIYYTYGGSSESHRPLMAANLLMWEVMRLGKRLGATKLDMWGSLPPDFDGSDPWAGFTRFKQGYGTQFVQSPGSYDLTTNTPLYHVYNLVQSIRTKLL